MRNTERLAVVSGSIALACALTGFLLGPAPFTPALILAVAALPIATFSFWFGARRISMLAAYWAVAALLTAPLANSLQLRIDLVLVALGSVGIAFAAVLLRLYRRSGN